MNLKKIDTFCNLYLCRKYNSLKKTVLELISDNHLMTHVKKGDLQKMNLLFHRYHKRLYGFFWHNNLDQTICEDLVQTVFYRMIRYRESFDESLTFRTWMFALAKNALADEVKKTKHREHAHQESSRELSTADTDKNLQKTERNENL